MAAVALAKPHVLLEHSHDLAHVAAPLVYAAPSVHVKLVPGAPLGYDGRVVDTPEVAHAKAEHNAAHVNEKIALAHEAIKSADHESYHYAHATPAVVTKVYASVPVATSHASYQAALPVHHVIAPVAYTKLVPAAPLGADGRVVDTPEVAHAKAAHAAAHAHEKLSHSHENAHYLHYEVPQVKLVSAYPSGSYASQW